MSRSEVRTAVADFLAPPAVAGLVQVKRAQPRNVAPGAYFAHSGDKTGAIGYVYIEGEHESRISAPQGGGWKQMLYIVGVRLDFRSLLNDTEAGIDAYDALVDGIKSRLRSDAQLGTAGGVVFQAGEGDTFGAPDIEVISDLPREHGDVTTIWSVLRFLVVQMIQA